MGQSAPPAHLPGVYIDQKIDVTHPRFQPSDHPSPQTLNKPIITIIPPFQRMQQWQVELEAVAPTVADSPNVLVSNVYFRDQSSMDRYIGCLLSLKQRCNVSIYNQIQTKQEQHLYCLTTKQHLPEAYRPLYKSQLAGGNINKFLDLLIFVSEIIQKTKNMFIVPDEIFECNGQYYLRSFYYKEYSKSRLLLSFITWIHEQFDSFKDIFENEQVLSFIDFDVYLKQVYGTLKTEKVSDQHLTTYMKRVKAKYNYLNYNFDSFQACSRAKKMKNKHHTIREWLLCKKQNEIYFFHIKDRHLCQGRLIRKKKKVMVEGSHIIFNQDDLQVYMMLEGTKNIIKTSDFELSDCFTISDIEIKFKFPFKLKNPLMFMKGRQIHLYDQLIYKYNIDENKLYQESKKINDCIYLAPSNEHSYMAIRLSIDIFRHGIRIYVDDKYFSLLPSGNPSMANEIEHLKIDLKSVDFCLQVFRGVYLMMASQNLWILDTNFQCFFSYAPIEKVKKFFKNKTNAMEDDYVFDIIDQPFPAKWLSNQDSLNVYVQGQTLYVLGTVLGKLYFLEYQFLLEAGMLRLKSHQPLFMQTEPIYRIKEECVSGKKQFTFNIYTQNFDFFKTNKWIYHGPIFLEVEQLASRSFKGYTEITIQTEQVLASLKDVIEQKKSSSKKWTTFQTAMLLANIGQIFTELNKSNISHKHFSTSNIWISKSRKLKLIGWSEPHRNWYISDYRDYLLACFNVITLNNSEKITDKLLEKHQAELSHFPVLKEKMHSSLKSKSGAKKMDQQKFFLQIRESLHKSIFPKFQSHRTNNYIFSFEFNTPRFSMLSIAQGKIKKMIAVIQGSHNNQEFTFKSSDSYSWNEEVSQLYIFTANYQMHQATINVKDFKEEKIQLEQYEYPPQNIVDCSFINTPKGLFAFGGIARCSKKKILFNLNIYHFNRQKLTWKQVAELPQPRLNPKLVPSTSTNQVLIMGGHLDYGPQQFQVLSFDTNTMSVQSWIDMSFPNPFRQINNKQTHKIFQISEEQHLFLLWTASVNSYHIKIFSNVIGSLDVQLDGKIYLQDYGQMPSISVAMVDGAIHFLRPYGKYTKISLGNLQTTSVSHKTLYN